MHKCKIKSKHPINNQPTNPDAATHRHPPPTSGEQTPSPTALSGDFSGQKKKKKKIYPLRVAAIHPNGKGREIRPP
jgi:hypothetical protein